MSDTNQPGQPIPDNIPIGRQPQPLPIHESITSACLEDLWHQYRDEEHTIFTDDEWIVYKALFKRGPNFPDWLKTRSAPIAEHIQPPPSSPLSLDGKGDGGEGEPSNGDEAPPTQPTADPLPALACTCVRPIDGSWIDLDSARTIPYWSSNLFSAAKDCRICGGSGRTPGFAADDPIRQLNSELRQLAASLVLTGITDPAPDPYFGAMEAKLLPIINRLLAIAAHVEEKDRAAAVRVEDNARYEAEQLQAVERVVKNHQQRIHITHCGQISDQIASILEHYHDKALRSMSHTDQFQQELLVNFRALALVANSAAEGHTHGEKNARLRGLISMLEGAYDKISKWRIGVQSTLPPWSYEPVFQANYPAQHYLRRISDLEAHLAKVTGEPVKHSVFPQKDNSEPEFDRW